MPPLYKKNFAKKITTSEPESITIFKSQDNVEFKHPKYNYQLNKTPVTPEQINFKATIPTESASFEIKADTLEQILDDECMEDLYRNNEKADNSTGKVKTVNSKCDTDKHDKIIDSEDESKLISATNSESNKVNGTKTRENDSNHSDIKASLQLPSKLKAIKKSRTSKEKINTKTSSQPSNNSKNLDKANTKKISKNKLSTKAYKVDTKQNKTTVKNYQTYSESSISNTSLNLDSGLNAPKKPKRNKNTVSSYNSQKKNVAQEKRSDSIQNSSKHTSSESVLNVSSQSIQSIRSSEQYKEAFRTFLLSQNQFELSQPSQDLTQLERLQWTQERRDIGLNVQCDKCDKWRFLEDVKDPLELPDLWYCHMNKDKKYNKCSLPEQYRSPQEEEDFIHNEYNAGSIVWAKMEGYSWWPAMVDDDPDTEVYYWLEGISDIPTWYHVVFFDSSEVSRVWLKPKQITGFKNNMNKKQYDLPKSQKMLKYRYTEAKKQAIDALELTILDRLRTYSFISRWKKGIKKPKVHEDDVNSEIKKQTKQSRTIVKRSKKKSDLESIHAEAKTPTKNSDETTSKRNKIRAKLVENDLPQKSKTSKNLNSQKAKLQKTANEEHDERKNKKSLSGKNKFAIDNFTQLRPQSPDMFEDDFGINDSPISNLSGISIPFNINFD